MQTSTPGAHLSTSRRDIVDIKKNEAKKERDNGKKR
jgi:hypothetical protein